jgi:HEAT repeat protein
LSAGSAELVGPLVEHAATPGMAARTEVLELLAAIALAVRSAGTSLDNSDGMYPVRCREALRVALPALLGLLGDDDAAVRAAAAAVLGELTWCAAEVVPVVRARFAGERAHAVRLALVLAVGHLLDTADDLVHERPRARRWLQRRRTGDDPTLRLAGALLARRAGRSRALPTVIEELADAGPVPVPGTRLCDLLATELGPDREARIAVAARLFEVRGGAGQDALRAAAGAICTWRSAAAPLLPIVAGRLTDADPGVRAAACHLVATAGAGEPERYADPLAELLTDPTTRVADLAAWGLARMGDERCLPRLRNRVLMGTSVFDVVQAYYPRHVYLFTAPGLYDVLAPLRGWAARLLPRVDSALADADSFHQQRALAAVLRAWGTDAAPAVPGLVPLLESDAAEHVCAALGAIGPAAAGARHRLFRLVERGNSRVRVAAARAHWRVTGDPEPALRVLSEALAGELAVVALPLAADLGPLAARHVGRIREIARAVVGAGSRVDVARADWRLTGDTDLAAQLLLTVLAPLAAGRVGPATLRAAIVAAEIAEPRLAGPLSIAAGGDERLAFYGDWRAVADDEQLRGYATLAPAYPTLSTSTMNRSAPVGRPLEASSP